MSNEGANEPKQWQDIAQSAQSAYYRSGQTSAVGSAVKPDRFVRPRRRYARPGGKTQVRMTSGEPIVIGSADQLERGMSQLVARFSAGHTEVKVVVGNHGLRKDVHESCDYCLEQDYITVAHRQGVTVFVDEAVGETVATAEEVQEEVDELRGQQEIDSKVESYLLKLGQIDSINQPAVLETLKRTDRVFYSFVSQAVKKSGLNLADLYEQAQLPLPPEFMPGAAPYDPSQVAEKPEVVKIEQGTDPNATAAFDNQDDKDGEGNKVGEQAETPLVEDPPTEAPPTEEPVEGEESKEPGESNETVDVEVDHDDFDDFDDDEETPANVDNSDDNETQQPSPK